MASRKRPPAGHRKRAFRIRNHELPDFVHELREFIYDTCLNFGVCPNCLHNLLAERRGKNGRVTLLSKCEACLRWHRDYRRRWELRGRRRRVA